MKKTPLLFEDAAPGQPLRPASGSVVRGLMIVVGIFLATRLLVWTAAYSGAVVHLRIQFNLEPPLERQQKAFFEKVRDDTTPEHHEWHKRMTRFGPLTVFDGQHYRSIIDGGYQYKSVTWDDPPMVRQQNIAFFPLFPLLCMPLSAVLATDAAMVLVAHAASLAAAILIYLWLRRRIDEYAALFCVAFVFCLPSACYFSFAYAESVTLLTTVITLFLIERRWFFAAAIACGIATAARPTALGLVPIFALAYLCVVPLRFSRPLKEWLPQLLIRLVKLVPLTFIAAAGIVAYAAYLTVRFGSPFVYVKNFHMGWVPESQSASWVEFVTLAPVWNQFKYFGHVLAGGLAGLPKLLYPFTWNMPMNLFILFLSLGGMFRVPRSFRPLLLLGPLIFLHSYLASRGANFGIEPIGRYMSVAVPAMAVLAAWSTREWRPGPRYVLLSFMLFLQGAWAFHFGLNEWSG